MLRLAPQDIQVGKRYYRRSSGFSVREVLKIFQKDDKDWITFKYVYATQKLLNTIQTTKLKTFIKWAAGCCDSLSSQNYDDFVGCQIDDTYLVKDTKGTLVFRCGMRRASFYLKRGYAVQLDKDTIQLTNDEPLSKIGKRFPGHMNNPFFFAKKNTHCVVCGRTNLLTRHHVVPQRYKKFLPLEVRQRISNVLFVCRPCHQEYEKTSEQFDARIADIADPLQKVRLWEKHFRAVMKPNHVPRGWHLLMAISGIT